MKARINKELMGKWFLSFILNDGKREMNWQGQVMGKLETGYYLVQLYSWMDGCPTCQQVIHLSSLKMWQFYENNKDMIEASKNYTKNEGR